MQCALCLGNEYQECFCEKWVSRGFQGSLESVRNGYLEGFRGVKGADKAASPNWRDFALVCE